MISVKCRFKRGSVQGEVYYQDFLCYVLNDRNLPQFVPKNELPQAAKILKEGDHIRTEDDYVVPVIKAWRNFFRIPQGGTYSRWHVRKGQRVYFSPPREHKLVYDYSATFSNHTRETD